MGIQAGPDAGAGGTGDGPVFRPPQGQRQPLPGLDGGVADLDAQQPEVREPGRLIHPSQNPRGVVRRVPEGWLYVPQGTTHPSLAALARELVWRR